MKKKNKFGFGARISTLVLVLVAFAFGYLFGHANLQLDNRYIPRLVNTDLGKPSDVDFSLFWQVYNELSSSYLRSIDSQKALYGAINGLVGSLDDPYSSFLTPEESKLFQEDLSGKLEGIGAEIGRRNGVPTIITPLEGSPAQEAGLKAGDQIVAVDGEYTDNLSIDAVVAKIRGKQGTEVTLTILKPDATDTVEIKITRKSIDIEDVTWTQDNDVAIITMRQFGDNSADQFSKAATEIQQAGINKIILDLRNNPGGLLDRAVDIAGFFLPNNSVVVQEQPRDGVVEQLSTNSDPVLADQKLVVLVNKGSASASEILAGALQDYGRATVIGETTYGKGTVQVFKDLDLGAALKLTIAEWLTPKSRHIEENGITPDITVERTDEDIDKGVDPQLERAKTVVNKM